MNAGSIVVLILFAWVGYILVSFLIDRFFTSKNPDAVGSPLPLDAVYAKTLGVRVGATMAELEEALARAVAENAPDCVENLRSEDRQLAMIRLEQANRAFSFLSQRQRIGR